jgi:uncharacterized protein (TIGR02246 family)
MNNITCAVAALAVLAAPAAAQESPKALQEAFVAAVVAEDAKALAALYTDDADSYDPGGSIQKGRTEIAANWQAFFDGFDNFEASLDQKGQRKMKDAHAAWGLWTMSATPREGGDRVVMKGRFLDLSVKTKDGWKYLVDHASMLAPEAGPAE